VIRAGWPAQRTPPVWNGARARDGATDAWAGAASTAVTKARRSARRTVVVYQLTGAVTGKRGSLTPGSGCRSDRQAVRGGSRPDSGTIAVSGHSRSVPHLVHTAS